jgi:SNF2 family DNA or RNA helicase
MFKGTLKPYQTEAVEKMVSQKRILVAYEMGLGKTPMTIAAIENLDSHFTLVICLASLKYQWQKEIHKFSDKKALVIDGTSSQRTKQYQEMFDYDYVVMNYEQVVNDWDAIKSASFTAIVCDEATAIKGFKAKRAKRVKELAKNIPIKFALTGTPIENGRPEEIFSIMQFVEAKVLGRFDIFDKTFIVRNYFGGVERYRNLPLLHETLKKHSVRKAQKDEDVKPYLPDAIYREPILVKLDKTTQSVYNSVSADLLSLLYDAKETFGTNFSLAAHYGQEYNPDDPANQLRGEIMSRISTLRMLCSNPLSLKTSKLLFDTTHGGAGSAYISSLGEALEPLQKTVKVETLIKYLSDHLDIDPSYKVVVFSSFLESVDKIKQSAILAGYEAVKYTGEMNAKEKEKAKEAFQSQPNIRILISSDAGGYGVDLPQANLLVNFDQPWSAGLAVQRNGRIIRTSSEWPTITIQDILIENSIEERQYDTLKQKRSVADAILDGEGINSKGGVDLTVGSLINFLTTKQI